MKNIWRRSLTVRILAGLALSLLLSTSALSQPKNYQSLFANVNGVRIHYLKAGTGKTPLVVVHGFGDTSHMWVPLFSSCSKWEVISLALDCFCRANGTKQLLAKRVLIRLPQAEGAGEDASLVPSAWMIWAGSNLEAWRYPRQRAQLRAASSRPSVTDGRC